MPDCREVDEDIVNRADVVVDCRRAAQHEAGDLILAGPSSDSGLT
jgi:ornithine cyclodeaminase/alanine dehydrogenase-like protein (mu-crystallin family)